MITLFMGALAFVAYALALVIGGDVAPRICDVVYNKVFPITVYASTVTVLFGLLSMYLAGEIALTASKKKDSPKKEQKQ